MYAFIFLLINKIEYISCLGTISRSVSDWFFFLIDQTTTKSATFDNFYRFGDPWKLSILKVIFEITSAEYEMLSFLQIYLNSRHSVQFWCKPKVRNFILFTTNKENKLYFHVLLRVHTGNLLWNLLNQTKLRLYLPFSDWLVESNGIPFGSKATVNTVWFRFAITRFRNEFSVCSEQILLCEKMSKSC